MDPVDLHAEAWEGIRNGFAAGRLAHAYMIVGSPRGNALQFSESILKLLFCEAPDKPCNQCVACRQVDAHKHVDTMWLEPQSKSRQIRTGEVRGLIHRMEQTSFEGGWKAGIILCADCMNEGSENALLKTLEEPPNKTLLLLVTDTPQGLLPTINSRCQRIVLSEGTAGGRAASWRLGLLDILRALPPSSGLEAARLAGQLKGLFDVAKAGIADTVLEELGQADEALDESKLKDIIDARTNARLKEVKAEVFRVMLDWCRDVLMLVSGVETCELVFADESDVLNDQAGHHTLGSALQSVQAVEGMARRLERNIPDLHIFDEAFRRLVRR